MKNVVFLAIVLIMFSVTAHAAGVRDAVSSAVDLTPSGTWVDVGTEIDCEGATDVGLYIQVNGKDATAVKFRTLCLTDEGGSLEYTMPILSLGSDLTIDSSEMIYQLSGELTQNVFINIDTDRTVQAIQFQGKSEYTGTPANVETLKVKQNR